MGGVWYAGIYLSDIAEIRGGMASHGFSQFVDCVEKHDLVAQEERQEEQEGRQEGGRQRDPADSGEVASGSGDRSRSLLSQALECPPPPSSSSSARRESCIPLRRVIPEQCLSIIGYECTLDLQLLDVEEDHTRDWFIDMLSLLSIKSLTCSHIPDGGYAGKETVLRLRHWRRVKTNSSYVIKNSRSNSRSTSISSSNNMLSMPESDFGEVTLAAIGGTVPPLCQYPPPNSNLNPRRLAEAQLFMEILCESIEIEEERFDGSHPHHHHGGLIESNTLWLEPNLMRIYVMPTTEDEEAGMSQVKGGDMKAIRVSKCLFNIDTTFL
jgi:hypothetical protein